MASRKYNLDGALGAMCRKMWSLGIACELIDYYLARLAFFFSLGHEPSETANYGEHVMYNSRTVSRFLLETHTVWNRLCWNKVI
jgi:hypothetical protein